MKSLTTRRLLLRSLRIGDAHELYTILADEEVTRYDDLATFTSWEDAGEFISRSTRVAEMHAGFRWAIIMNDKLIGTCGYIYDALNFKAKIGYQLERAYWRQGIMCEALTAVICYLFASGLVMRVEAYIMPANIASCELLNKLDFTLEGTLKKSMYFKGAYHDMCIYAKIKD